MVSGQWAARASFSGWEEGSGKRPRKRYAGSSGSLDRLPLLHQDTPAGEQVCAPAVPYESHLLVRAADQPAGSVLWGLGPGAWGGG